MDQGLGNHGSMENLIANKPYNMDVERNDERLVVFARGIWKADGFASQFKETNHSFP
jgi:hypothetical protein